ncbi:hypothetical protein D3C75_367780 [compost metagenome]
MYGFMPCRLRCLGIAVLRQWNTEISTQGATFVFSAEQTPLLQNRHYPIDEFLQSIRNSSCDHKSVCSSTLKPGLNLIRHLLRCANKAAARGSGL